MGEIHQPISMPRSSLDKIESNLLSVFDVRGFLSITTFIVSRQQRFSYENRKIFIHGSVNGCLVCI